MSRSAGRDGRVGGAGGWWWSGGRVLTALRDGSRRGQVPVLSVHVVGSAPRVVAQPDTEVLHLQGRLLMDLKRTTSRR